MGGEGSDSSGGCGCGDTGGPARFHLEVYRVGAGAAVLLCKAGKPKRPGWDRDPRMACRLAEAGDYLLRVKQGSPEGHETLAAETAPASYPYLLNVTLRGIAANGSWLNRGGQDGVWQSRNRLSVVPF